MFQVLAAPGSVEGQQISNRVSQHQAGGPCAAATDFRDDSNCQGYWDLDDASNGDRLDGCVGGSAGANDLRDNNANLTTGTSSPDPVEGSGYLISDIDSGDRLELDDGDTSANFPTKAASSAVTWGCWINLSATSTNDIIWQKASSNLTLGFPGGGPGQQFNAVMTTTSATYDVVGDDSSLSIDTWYLVVARWTGSVFDLTVDGTIQADSDSTAGTWATNTTQMHFARSTDPLVRLDACFVLDRDLSDAEIDGILACGFDGAGVSP